MTRPRWPPARSASAQREPASPAPTIRTVPSRPGHVRPPRAGLGVDDRDRRHRAASLARSNTRGSSLRPTRAAATPSARGSTRSGASSAQAPNPEQRLRSITIWNVAMGATPQVRVREGARGAIGRGSAAGVDGLGHRRETAARRARACRSVIARQAVAPATAAIASSVEPEQRGPLRVRPRHDPVRAAGGEHREREPVQAPPDAESDAPAEAGRRHHDEHQIAREHAERHREPRLGASPGTTSAAGEMCATPSSDERGGVQHERAETRAGRACGGRRPRRAAGGARERAASAAAGPPARSRSAARRR